MLCLRCYGAMPSISKHATQRIQSHALKAISGMPSGTSPTLRQSSRLLTTTTRSTPTTTQLARFSSPILSRATTPTLPTSSSLLPSSTRSFSATSFLGAKRDTYNPSRRVQKRRHGFLARLRCRGGRKILMRRRQKGRKNMSW